MTGKGACLLATALMAASAFAASAQLHGGKRFDSGGVSLRYVDEGSGPAVVLLHGFGGTLAHWRGLSPRLVESGFRVIAYDARGHGESGKPAAISQYGEEDVKDVFRILDHLGIQRAHLVGYSRGAWIAARAVLQQPERVSSLVVGGWGAANPVDTLFTSACESTAALIERGEPPVPLLRALTPQGKEAPISASPNHSIDERTAHASAFRADCRVLPVDVRALTSTRVPVLAVVGADDAMVTSVRRMLEQVPAAKATILPGATHFTAPRMPEFVNAITAFLNTRGRASVNRPATLADLSTLP